MTYRNMLKKTLIVMPITAAATLFSLRTNLSSAPVVHVTTNAWHTIKALLLHGSGVAVSAFAAALFATAMRERMFCTVARQVVPVTLPSPNKPIRI